MPITLTLTDDQALEIMAQVGSLLKKGSPPTIPTLSHNDRIRQAVQEMKANTVFRTALLFHELNLTADETKRTSLSSACAALIKEGELKMLQRGTWKRL